LSSDTGFVTDGWGNYTEDNTCAWLIHTGRTDSVVRLSFREFQTECGWDNLYIYDGDSAFDPLIAVFR
jgi:hypothetical protein